MTPQHLMPGYWSITKDVIDMIHKILNKKGTILELGSGEATEELAKYYKIYSIESEQDWLNKYNSTYLYVPVVECTKELFPYNFDYFYANRNITPSGKISWYDPVILRSELAKINTYDLLLIDGPNECRLGMLSNLHLFNLSVPVIIDDLHCTHGEIKPARSIAEEISRITGRKLECYDTQTGFTDNPIKTFGVV